jgi:hypothetical protein
VSGCNKKIFYKNFTQFFFFFVFNYLQNKNKINKHKTQNAPIYKHQATYLQNTSTSPPNSKCHNVHNVTEKTKPKGRFNLGIA